MLKDKSYKKQDDQVSKNEDITKNVSKPERSNKIISIIPHVNVNAAGSKYIALFALTENGDIFAVNSNGKYNVILNYSEYVEHTDYNQNKKDEDDQ